MKFIRIATLIAISYCFSLSIQGQTIYGVHGLIKIPDAYTLESGRVSISCGYFKDYYQPGEPDFFREQWTVNLNAGFHSRFEIGGRLGGIPSAEVKDTSVRYDFRIDRVLSTKFVLLQEQKNWLQLSLGLQDIAGTRLFNSTYLVASKQIDFRDSSFLQLTVGWGTKLGDEIFGVAENYRFIDLFGGVMWQYKKWGWLMIEYDGKDVNGGIGVRLWKWLELRGYFMDLKEVGGGVSFVFEL